MKKSLLLISLALLTTHAFAKVTYDDAIKSAKKSADYYDSISVTPAQSQADWDSHKQIPRSGTATPKALKVEWTGSAASVPNSWGEGEYYIDINFDKNNEGGSVWITANNNAMVEEVAIPSPFNYEGNYHVRYENGTFTSLQHKTSGHPTITRIQKLVH